MRTRSTAKTCAIAPKVALKDPKRLPIQDICFTFVPQKQVQLSLGLQLI